jgi:hypothetical protein
MGRGLRWSVLEESGVGNIGEHLGPGPILVRQADDEEERMAGDIGFVTWLGMLTANQTQNLHDRFVELDGEKFHLSGTVFTLEKPHNKDLTLDVDGIMDPPDAARELVFDYLFGYRRFCHRKGLQPGEFVWPYDDEAFVDEDPGDD